MLCKYCKKILVKDDHGRILVYCDHRCSEKDHVGKNHPAWKDELATYSTKHAWISRHYGRPQSCEICLHTDRARYDWANISGRYTRIRTDWKRLCRSCHWTFDKIHLREHLNKNNKSGYRGVHWDKPKKRWTAIIKVKHRNIFAGRFPTKERAARAYNNKFLQYYPDDKAPNMIH